MKIVTLKSGLGNQMFQYALYRELQNVGFNTKMSREYIDNNSEHNGYELETVFGLKPNIASLDEINNCRNHKSGLYERLRNRLSSRDDFAEIERFINIDIFFVDNIILNGYWQHEFYFKHVKEQLKKEFEFPEICDMDNLNNIVKIQTSNSVGVHIRKGDYLSKGFIDYYGSICDEKYYSTAIELMCSKIKNPSFFIFSDDMEWVHNNLILPNEVTYINNNKGQNAFKDMQLMMECKHLVIANSTFSWWAAWLSESDDKIIVAPKKWCKSNRRYKNALSLKRWTLI